MHFRTVLTVFVFSLIFGFTRTDDDICKSLRKIEKFKTKSVFYFEGKEYHIEEYQLGDRGKLIVTLNTKTTEFYYEAKKDQKEKFDVLIFERDSNKCTKRNFIPYLVVHQDAGPFAFFDRESGMFGPSALFFLLQKLQKKMPSKSEELERGINTIRCDLSGKKLAKFTKPKAEIYISTSDWSLFDQQKSLGDVYLPIRLNFEAEGPIGPKIFRARIDYLTFETIKDFKHNLKLHEFDEEEDWWIAPAVCPALNNNRAPIQVPAKIKFVFDELDEIKMQEKSGDYLLRKAVVLDQQDDSLRFDNQIEDAPIKIFEPKNKILFEIVEGMNCKQYLNKPMNESPELIELLKSISKKSSTDYFLVGNQMVRGVLTDVYRKESEDKDTLDRTAVTLYLSELTSESDDQPILHQPLQIRIEEFHKSEGVYQRTASRLYNIFEFETIDENELVKSLDISECVDSSLMVDLILIAESDQNELDALEMKKELRTVLAQETGLTALNFPKVEFQVHPGEVIARIKFVEIVSPLAYFQRSTAEKLPLKDQPDNKVEAVSSIECAVKTLKFGKAFGFQYCEEAEPYCDIITNSQRAIAIEMKDANLAKCVVAFKEGKAAEKWFEYVSFEEKTIKLIKSVKTKKIKLALGDLTFSQIHRIKEQSDVDTSKLYELKAKGQKFAGKKFKKKIEAKDGIVNLEACYQACAGLKDDVCDTFSFCRKHASFAFDCYLGAVNRQNVPEEDDGDFLETDEQCDTYMISASRHFEEHSDMRLKAKNDDTILRSYADSNSAECAQDCLNFNMENDEQRCYSVEICQNEKQEKTDCKLSSTQTLWDEEKEMLPDRACSVYSIKHLLNFTPSTKVKLVDFVRETVNSIDQCASKCDSVGDCERFNYCETEAGGSECRYVSQKMGGKSNTKLESEEIGCVTWTHRNRLIGAPKNDLSIEMKTNVVEKNSGRGFRKGSVAGLVFLFMFVGIAVGAVAFYGRRKYLSRDRETQATAIRFSELQEDS